MVVRLTLSAVLATQLVTPAAVALFQRALADVDPDRAPRYVRAVCAWTPTATGVSPAYALDCDRFVATQGDAPAPSVRYLTLGS